MTNESNTVNLQGVGGIFKNPHTSVTVNPEGDEVYDVSGLYGDGNGVVPITQENGMFLFPSSTISQGFNIKKNRKIMLNSNSPKRTITIIKRMNAKKTYVFPWLPAIVISITHPNLSNVNLECSYAGKYGVKNLN